VPHISLVFREMWDTASLPLNHAAGPIEPPIENKLNLERDKTAPTRILTV
jgi:hypothetical protein